MFKYNVRRLWIIYFLTTFQDPDASFDVNSHDKDPQPHYDYTNENRWRQFLLWIKKWKHEGHSEQSASSCPQNAKVQLIFSWIEVESGNVNLIMDDKIGILKSGRTHVSGACPMVDWLLSCLVKRLGRSISDVGTATSAIDTISTQIWPDYGNSIYSNGCFSVFQWWARPGLVLIWPTISCLNLFNKTLKWSLVSLYKLSKKTFIRWIQY